MRKLLAAGGLVAVLLLTVAATDSNMDPGGGGIWCVHAAPPYYVKCYDPYCEYFVQPVVWYSNPWCG